MKVLFLQRDPFEKLGISILSAALKEKGYSCEVLVEDLEKDIVGKALRMNPDIIAFSIATSEYSWMSKIGKEIRERFEKPIICGGPHPTFYPEVIKEGYLDAICLGEGEEAILDFVNALEKGEDTTKIKNLFVKKDGRIYKNELRPLINDLDSNPLPDRSIYDQHSFFRNQNNRGILTGRGCPFRCSFCFNRSYNEMYCGKGKVVRKRGAEEIIQEIKELKKQAPNFGHIMFADDLFVLPKGWLSDFLETYKKEVNLPFSCSARADLVDEDIVQKLKNANCFSIRMGVESGNERLRNTILKKEITNEQIVNSASLIKKHRIRLLVYNILGAPGETLNNAFETFELNKKIRPTYAWCSLLQPYPRTEIFEYAVEHNYLSRDYDIKELENSYFIDTPIKMENKKEICNFQKIFPLSVLLGLPSRWVRFLIRLPFGKFYELLFKINYAIGILRIDNMGWAQIIKTAIFSKGYFKKEYKTNSSQANVNRLTKVWLDSQCQK